MKVQRPGIGESIAIDMLLVRRLMSVVDENIPQVRMRPLWPAAVVGGACVWPFVAIATAGACNMARHASPRPPGMPRRACERTPLNTRPAVPVNAPP